MSPPHATLHSLAKQGDNALGSVRPSVCLFALSSKEQLDKSHYQSCLSVCLQPVVYADNHADAVDWNTDMPKPGCHEAEAFRILEAEALTFVYLEAEAKALIMKPKPSQAICTVLCGIESGHLILESESGSESRHLKVEALVHHEAEAFEIHKAQAQAQVRLSKI